jgi:hypothetical protein
VMGLECCCGSFWTGGELEFHPLRQGVVAFYIWNFVG